MPQGYYVTAYDVHNHRLALARALEHLQELESQTKGWREGKGYLVSHEFKRERSEYIVWVEQVATLNTATLSVLVGDCLHNLSSSLNFLAYELALAHTNPLSDKAADEVEFPIFGDVDRKGQVGMGHQMFRKGAPRRIRSMATGAQAVIECLQPYKRNDSFTDDPLWQLYELARINRHRILHPAVATFSGAAWNPANTSNAAIGPGNIYSFGGFIEGRTKVASFPVRPIDTSQEVYVDLYPPIDIAFAKGTPVVAGEPMTKVLSEIYNYIVDGVLPPLQPFL